MIEIICYYCNVCGGEIPVAKDAKKTCTCAIPQKYFYSIGGAKLQQGEKTLDSILKIVEGWQQFWMNQTLDPEDTKRYRERACGIDANMRHDLAEKIMEVLK